MPSSTSSFDPTDTPQPPQGPWRKTVLLGAGLIIVASLALELLGRGFGLTPQVIDDGDLWCAERAKVRPGDTEQMVLVGASRMQMDVVPEVLAKHFERGNPVQLAVNGRSSTPALKDFAADPTFNGILLCDVMPGHYFGGQKEDSGTQATYVQHWHSRSFVSSIERPLSTALQSMATLRLLGWARDEGTQVWWKTGRKPKPVHVRMLANRSIIADFKTAKIDQIRALYLRDFHRAYPEALSEDKIEQNISRLEPWVKEIQARGGRVVFLRLPVAGQLRDEEDRVFPVERCWKRLEETSSAICINFADYPYLARFECPDGSHLDGADREAFTNELAKVLKEKLPSPANPQAKQIATGSAASRIPH